MNQIRILFISSFARYSPRTHYEENHFLLSLLAAMVCNASAQIIDTTVYLDINEINAGHNVHGDIPITTT